MSLLATTIAAFVISIHAVTAAPAAPTPATTAIDAYHDGKGHTWHDGDWHNDTDGTRYIADGLGHVWQSGIWYNSDGTPYAPPPPPLLTWEDWARAAGWPAELMPALSTVMRCESTFSPYARNGQYLGLMQLSPMWFAYAGEDLALWADPVVNLRTAYAVYRYDVDQGSPAWNQWQCKA